ncbi:MAG: alpha/beta hydrolase-fold protein [Terracidiphilus sp.]|nr:alpha/beta hydrolase-fold protein [Terracidiphilus sp.]
MKTTHILLFVALTLLTTSGCHRVAVPLPDHPRMADGVEIQDMSLYSTALGRTMPYRVFLPTQHTACQALPVVYLLHGNWENYRSWSNNSYVAQYARQGLVLVMPEGDSSYYVNAVKASSEKYRDYLTHDLIAGVEANFPVRKDRAGRAVVGVSMGGYGAVEYALARPDLFAFAGAISPAIDVPSRKFSWRHWNQGWRFRRIFGAVGSPEQQALDPFVQIRTASPQAAPYLYISTGQNEPLPSRFTALLRSFMHEALLMSITRSPAATTGTNGTRRSPDALRSC